MLNFQKTLQESYEMEVKGCMHGKESQKPFIKSFQLTDKLSENFKRNTIYILSQQYLYYH